MPAVGGSEGAAVRCCRLGLQIRAVVIRGHAPSVGVGNAARYEWVFATVRLNRSSQLMPVDPLNVLNRGLHFGTHVKAHV